MTSLEASFRSFCMQQLPNHHHRIVRQSSSTYSFFYSSSTTSTSRNAFSLTLRNTGVRILLFMSNLWPHLSGMWFVLHNRFDRGTHRPNQEAHQGNINYHHNSSSTFILL